MRLEDIHFDIPRNVYPPREDSWLLAKALPKAKGKTCLDMGCGAGIQTMSLLLNGAERVVAVDIDETALTTAKHIITKHFDVRNVRFVKSDLFSNVSGKYDLIVFNTPYVPTSNIRWKDTDGGKLGREIIDRFLEELPEYLKENGMCYLLQSSKNKLSLTQEKCDQLQLQCTIIALHDLPGEELQIIKITRKIEDYPESYGE